MGNIIVMGAGRVGRAIALDLAAAHRVTSVDVNSENLHLLPDSVKAVQMDLSKTGDLPDLLDEFDLVVSAVPGFLGYDLLKRVIQTGKNIVDLSFSPENPLELDEMARQNNLTAMVDFGVAPGMSNAILGYHDTQMKVEKFECLVGGLPKKREWPFEYKAPFSPVDVIEEYIRPARYVENGRRVTRPALTDIEQVTFDEVGTLETFNTDGLRTLLFTMSHIPDMKEKTLRYPGHARLIQALKTSGFFDPQKFASDGCETSPLEMTSRILEKVWNLKPGEEEFTVMRVTVEGTDDNLRKIFIYHLYDEYDARSGLTSMARTTGFTCSAAANLILEGSFTENGLFPPEYVGKDPQCFHYILNYLEERNVIYKVEEITEEDAS